jgi:hypothetical protein
MRSILGFIKGPVCRGQVVLDVIDDRFWIVFLRSLGSPTSATEPSIRGKNCLRSFGSG